MPDLVPKPRHEPPTWTDRILIHSVQVAVSVWWIIYAITLALGLSLGYGTLAGAVHIFSPVIIVSVSVMIFVGAILVIWAILTSARRLDLAWKVHQSGLILVGAGWALYTLVYIVVPGTYWYSITIGISQMLIPIAGFIAALFVERTTREVIRSQGIDA